jgi:hypothetical protein
MPVPCQTTTPCLVASWTHIEPLVPIRVERESKSQDRSSRDATSKGHTGTSHQLHLSCGVGVVSRFVWLQGGRKGWRDGSVCQRGHTMPQVGHAAWIGLPETPERPGQLIFAREWRTSGWLAPGSETQRRRGVQEPIPHSRRRAYKKGRGLPLDCVCVCRRSPTLGDAYRGSAGPGSRAWSVRQIVRHSILVVCTVPPASVHNIHTLATAWSLGVLRVPILSDYHPPGRARG